MEIEIDGVDLERVVNWMDELGIGVGPIRGVTCLTGGTQNILVRFERGSDRFVLRRPPINKRDNSDATMQREARVLTALRRSDVPHPQLLASCEDPAIIGASFYLMEAVEGFNPTIALVGRYLQDSAWREQLGLAMADGASSIAAVGIDASGLSALGRSDNFLQRQVSRWMMQLDSYRSMPLYQDALPAVDIVGKWLDENLPTNWRPGLIHGDYHLANVICDSKVPRIAAIVDWELATVGDPLLDLGLLLATWPDDRENDTMLRVEPWNGFPSKSALIERYRDQSDRDLSAIDWYVVMASFKIGIILEGTYARSLNGLAPKPTGDKLHRLAVGLLERASQCIRAS